MAASSPTRSTTTTTTVRTIQSSTVSSCITTYKKAPPPVPPRTTPPSKPFISITAQSSTESAQDAYMDGVVGGGGGGGCHGGGGGGGGRRTHISCQPALSNSTESIDSMKALTAAIEAANAQVHGPASQHVTSSSAPIPGVATETQQGAVVTDAAASRREEREALRKSLSIGIQVDGPEEEGTAEEQSKFQSVGIQVEEERCYRRLTRSNSVTTATQADLDDDDSAPPGGESPPPRRPSRDSTVSIQGSGNHYHACAAGDEGGGEEGRGEQEEEEEEVGEGGLLLFDPSVLPPPDPWMDIVAAEEEGGAGPGEEGGAGPVRGGGACPRDGRWFLKLLGAEEERMRGWCAQMQREQDDNQLNDEILGKIRSAVGSAQLLMSRKFQQFRELCEENLNPNAHPRPVSQDLAGFWDMLQLSIENISLKFDELHQLRANSWRPLDPPQERRTAPPAVRKPQPGRRRPPMARDRSLESSERQRMEARKRLLAAKRAASARQSSATESADSIEIYIPEAQTRL